MYNVSMLTARETHNSPRKILAIKFADLGDLLTITPALQALRAAYPASRIDLLAPPRSAHLLQGAPYIDNILRFDKFVFDSLDGLLNVPGLIRTIRFLIRLRAAGYDTLAIFHHFTTRWGTAKFAALSGMSGATVRAGLENGRAWFLTHSLPDMGFGDRHEADYWLDVAGLLGADSGRGWATTLPLNDKDRARAVHLLQNCDRKNAAALVAVHPGVGSYSSARRWPVESFAGVVRALVEAHGAFIVILGGPDDIETASSLECRITHKRALNLAGKTTVHEMAAVIEQCDLLLSNDSGPMHIAVAVDTPVVAVFGPSNQRAWGPYVPPGKENIHTIVARDLPCMPCFYRGHSLGLKEGCGPKPCLTGLSPQRALAACVASLARSNARASR